MASRIIRFIFLAFTFFNLNLSCNADENSLTQKIKVINEWENRYEYIFTDENENILFKKELRKFYGFNEGYATVVLMNWDYAILDENGNISDAHFIDLGQKFSEGKNFAMFMDKTTGIIDTSGNVLFKIDIEDIGGALAATPFFNGKALIKKSENLWFMIDEKGYKIREFNIFYANAFSCGVSRIQFRSNNIRKYNYINSDGNYISSIDFDDAHDFVNSTALVRIGNDEFYIDANGEKITK
ncbi:MAG: WG repeat-containing protein [Treponema sp.]|uniref:WG repeat-containing protein n=1 Tax=Treponema sp. TaxID=166 RepID=UPI0025D556BE|nr:WG repeat-containing protein [Treponema sp.]MBQ8680590.1 WG repeat-containing protein [Treponema sp.]